MKAARDFAANLKRVGRMITFWGVAIPLAGYFCTKTFLTLSRPHAPSHSGLAIADRHTLS